MAMLQTALQSEEKPKPSAAFEAATRKLGSGKSSAELFAETRKQEEKKFEEESQKDALKAIGKAVTVGSRSLIQTIHSTSNSQCVDDYHGLISNDMPGLVCLIG